MPATCKVTANLIFTLGIVSALVISSYNTIPYWLNPLI